MKYSESQFITTQKKRKKCDNEEKVVNSLNSVSCVSLTLLNENSAHINDTVQANRIIAPIESTCHFYVDIVFGFNKRV